MRNSTKAAFGTPHCQVCVMFLGQPVPVISTPRGYALFCEVCDLGRRAPTVRVRDAGKMQITVDKDEAAAGANSEEE
jgi:hypothetical protein